MQPCTYQLSHSEAPVARTALRRVDYADAHRVSGVPRTSARAWAHAVLEQAPPQLRARLVSGWRTLGLRPVTAPADAVLEWGVRIEEPDLLVLARRSWVGMPAELLFLTDDEGLLFSTLAHHAHPLVGPVWSTIVPAHVRTVQQLLTAGARRLAAAPAP